MGFIKGWYVRPVNAGLFWMNPGFIILLPPREAVVKAGLDNLPEGLESLGQRCH